MARIEAARPLGGSFFGERVQRFCRNAEIPQAAGQARYSDSAAVQFQRTAWCNSAR